MFLRQATNPSKIVVYSGGPEELFYKSVMERRGEV